MDLRSTIVYVAKYKEVRRYNIHPKSQIKLAIKYCKWNRERSKGNTNEVFVPSQLEDTFRTQTKRGKHTPAVVHDVSSIICLISKWLKFGFYFQTLVKAYQARVTKETKKQLMIWNWMGCGVNETPNHTSACHTCHLRKN